MKSLVEIHQVKKLAMPKIDCGLDRLQWPRVREILVEVFDGVEIEILICKWK